MLVCLFFFEPTKVITTEPTAPIFFLLNRKVYGPSKVNNFVDNNYFQKCFNLNIKLPKFKND